MTASMLVYGCQHPRIEHTPVGVVGSLGQQCIDLAAMAGLFLDPWQKYLLDNILSYTDEEVYNPVLKRAQKKWAAFEAAVIVSRQNGKGSLLEALELGGLFLFGDRLIIHSAHQFDTSKEAFERLLVLLESCPDFDSEIRQVSRNHGEEGVKLKSGQRIRFRTRTKGGGRGFTGDRLILDEAMYLGPTQISALMPTLSARPNPQIIYTGSAGDQESLQLGKVRHRAIEAEKGTKPADRLYFAEWSIQRHEDDCTGDCTEHDSTNSLEAFRKSNPGIGYRITIEHILAEQESMQEESFLQERLGIGDWPVESEQWTVIDRENWMGRMDKRSEITGPFVLAIHVSHDMKWSCITACGPGREGTIHVEVTGRDDQWDYRPGTAWVIARAFDIAVEHDPLAIIVHKTSQAGAFVDDFEHLKLRCETPTAAEYAQACGEFFADVVPRRGNRAKLIHMNQQPLTTAVAGAAKREVSDTWVWDRKTATSDITPLQSATLARWGYMKLRNEKPRGVPMMAWR